ncbi:hypothetical protein [Halocynthiibacter sp.]|uniref:hypothetical protein n=1 Tax=Halocynthiibacter sp. TaxID=1979210 RepID=UPI003C3CF4C0
MAIFARLIMIVVLTLLLIILLLTGFLILVDEDYSALYDLVDLDEDLPAAGLHAGVFGLVVMTLTIACLMRAFWAVHRIMQRSVQSDFLKLADHLRICAFAVIAFWVGIQFLLGPVSFALVAHIPADIRPPVDYFPFEMEAIYLVLALPLLVTASSLRRAAEIEEENSQFL